MAKQYDSLDDKLNDFILRQKIFFTASATEYSKVNVSPREASSFRLIDPFRVMYLDRTGSGNETAAHMLADGRLTIMFCAFEGPPQILRLYGKGRIVKWSEDEFQNLVSEYYDSAPLGTRQLVLLNIEYVQTSCGFGVPQFNFEGERTTLEKWHNNKGVDGIREYWREKNLTSIDGLPTGLLD